MTQVAKCQCVNAKNIKFLMSYYFYTNFERVRNGKNLRKFHILILFCCHYLNHAKFYKFYKFLIKFILVAK